MTHDEKRAALEQIAEELEELESSPLYDYRREQDYQVVVGEGVPDAEIMFIGEAPGAQEASSGRPFVGSAGRVLDGYLEAIGLDREDVYVTNVVKDRPPENRDPTKEEIAAYAPFLVRQVEVIQPRVIVTLGRFAMDYVLELFEMEEQGSKISDLHGQALETEAPYGELVVVPLYHPAAGFYNKDLRDVMAEDFQVLKELLESLN
jgi:DNA polymerase